MENPTKSSGNSVRLLWSLRFQVFPMVPTPALEDLSLDFSEWSVNGATWKNTQPPRKQKNPSAKSLPSSRILIMSHLIQFSVKQMMNNSSILKNSLWNAWMFLIYPQQKEKIRVHLDSPHKKITCSQPLQEALQRRLVSGKDGPAEATSDGEIDETIVSYPAW